MKQRYIFGLIVLFALLTGLALFIAIAVYIGDDTPSYQRENPIYGYMVYVFGALTFITIIYAIVHAVRHQPTASIPGLPTPDKTKRLLILLLILNLAPALLQGARSYPSYTPAVATIAALCLALIPKRPRYEFIAAVMLLGLIMSFDSISRNPLLMFFPVPIIILCIVRWWQNKGQSTASIIPPANTSL